MNFFKNTYATYLVLSVGLVVGYSFLNWLFIQHLGIVQPKREVVNVYIPAGLAMLFGFTILRRRMKPLMKNEKWLDFRSITLSLLLAASAMQAQRYVETQSGKLTTIETPSEIDNANPTRYYSIRQHEALKHYGSFWATRENANRTGSEIRITYYFVCPVIAPAEEGVAISPTFNHWLGVKYSETFSNSLLGRGRQPINIDQFEQLSTNQFRYHEFRTTYLENIPNSDDKDAFVKAIKRTGQPYDASRLKILTEKKGLYQSRAGNTMRWALGFLFAGNVVWLAMTTMAEPVAKPEPKPRKRTSVRTKKKASRRRERGFLEELIIPHKKSWAVSLIIDINIVVFVLMIFAGVSLINPQATDLVRWGGSAAKLTLDDGQWWRLLTSTFIHAGIVHIFCNLTFLLIISTELDYHVSNRQFLILYLLCGLCASITSVHWQALHTVSVGASGAILGMYGVYVALVLLRYIRGVSVMSILLFIGLNALYGLNESIDMAAHIGGLVSGFLIALVYFPMEKYFGKK